MKKLLPVFGLIALFTLLASPSAYGQEPPGDVPPGLKFSATHNSVTLSWDDPDDSTITGYRILRSVNWGTERTRARNVRATATSYTDRGLSSNTAYAYRVQPLRGTDVGPASHHILALTKARPRSSTSVSEPARGDLPAGTGTRGRLKIGDTVSGTISTHDDLDSFAVDVKAGVNYFMRLRYEGERTDGHGPLRIDCVRNAQGERYSRDPDTLCPAPSKEIFYGTKNERIYIEVGAAWGDLTYSLPIDYTLEMHPDNGNTDGTGLGRANGVGQWTFGSLHDQDSEDRYEIELCGGYRYRIPVFYNHESGANGAPYSPLAFLHNLRGPESGHYYTPPLVVKPEGAGRQFYHLDVGRWQADNEWYLETEPQSLGELNYRFFVELLDTGEDVASLVAVSEAPGTDLPEDTTTTGLLPFEQSVTGEIGEAGDADWFMLRFDDRKCRPAGTGSEWRASTRMRAHLPIPSHRRHLRRPRHADSAHHSPEASGDTFDNQQRRWQERPAGVCSRRMSQGPYFLRVASSAVRRRAPIPSLCAISLETSTSERADMVLQGSLINYFEFTPDTVTRCTS